MTKSDTAQISSFLKEIDFFRDLSEEEIFYLAGACREEFFPKGAVIFREGSRAGSFYIIVEGTVEVWREYYSANPDILAVHGKGNLFGEMALVDDLPRSATVVARDPVRLFSICRYNFHELIRRDSNIAVSLLKSLSAMVRKSNDYFVDGLRRQNVELQQANEELKIIQEEFLRAERFSNLGKFSSLILHDIRNPVSILRGYAEMILFHPQDPEKVEKYSQAIMKETDRLNLFVGELLDYSRGEIRLSLSIISLHQFFEKFTENVKDTLAHAKVKLIIENSYNEPVMFDEERMLRVFLNLCDNSRKAMRNGGELYINASSIGEDLVFTVRDTGIGMTKNVLDHIFEPFYSFAVQGGTGLGLVIVKNVVEAHGGTLLVSSILKTGTTFTIHLPLRG
jgi:signal transduction histidine kinase